MQSPSGKKPSTSETLYENERADTIATGTSLLTSGKRHLLASSIPLAVSDLAQSCELLSKVFGETAVECAEAYYYYGRALLEVSRLESGVLGNALDGVDMEAEEAAAPGGEADMVEDPDKMTKDEKLEVEEKVAEALEENFENHDRIARTHSPVDEDEGEGESMDQDEEEKPVEEGEKEPAGKTGEDKPESMEDEDPSNLQLAWEMFELAKVVYSKTGETATGDGKTESVSKLCDCYLGLGEVSLENENYTQAVADFTQCLVIRKANLPPDSRSIAEAHYQLGVAQALHGKYEDAESCLSSAIEVLEARVANLRKMETSHNIAREIADLEVLVAEIVEKISDHRTMEKSKAGDSTGKMEVKQSVDLTGAKVSGTATVGSA